MCRPVTDPMSYRFQANIHGTYDSATNTEEMQSWNQCERKLLLPVLAPDVSLLLRPHLARGCARSEPRPAVLELG